MFSPKMYKVITPFFFSAENTLKTNNTNIKEKKGHTTFTYEIINLGRLSRSALNFSLTHHG